MDERYKATDSRSAANLKNENTKKPSHLDIP